MKKSGEDRELWLRVAATVKPLAPLRAKAAAPAPRPAVKPPPQKPQIPKKETAPPPRGFDAATERKLKRGRLEVEGRLDLHGMTQGEAYDALRRFVDAARRKGRRTLLVITGKGRAPGSGVLRRLLPLWLAEDGRILACVPARPEDGGEGAFYVRIRKTEA